MVPRYGPGDTWPKHKEPFWSDALDVARDAGWTLVWLDAPHWWGRIECPSGEHVGLVDRTAKGGETKAKELKKDVRNCPHGTGGTGSKVQERERRCKELLGAAEALLDQVASALERIEGREDAYDRLAILESAQADVTDAAANIDELLSERSLDEALAEAWAQAEALDDAPRAATVRADLEVAETAADEARGTAVKIKRPGLSEPLRKRAEEALRRVEDLRTRLVEVQERTGAADG